MKFDRMLTTLENIVIAAVLVCGIGSLILIGLHLLTGS